MEAPFIDCPPRLAETWAWFVACVAFDAGNPEPLAKLIEGEQVPPEYRAKIAAAVRIGAPRKRTKIPATERAILAAHLEILHKLCRVGDADSVAIGDRRGMEPSAIRKEAWHEWRTILAEAGEDFGVSAETLENLMRDFRARIQRWPVV